MAAGIPGGRYLLRFTRSSILDVLNQEYMKTAKAIGLPASVKVLKHGLENGLTPVITLFGTLSVQFFGGIMAVQLQNDGAPSHISARHWDDYQEKGRLSASEESEL
jgi:ABC-type microcin C transport system permease subunit YejB